MRGQKVYDAVIIGSGASGGMAAKQLTGHGLEVLVLEAGPPVDPVRDMGQHTWPYEAMYRGFGPPGWKQQDQWMQDTASDFSRKAGPAPSSFGRLDFFGPLCRFRARNPSA